MGRPRCPVALVFFNLATRKDSLAMIGSVTRGLGGFGTSEEVCWHWGEAERVMMGRLSSPGVSLLFNVTTRKDSPAMIGRVTRDT